MVDKITNTLINLENKSSKNTAKVKDSISKVNNYGIGEDINHILMHMMMQFISLNHLNTSSKKIIL